MQYSNLANMQVLASSTRPAPTDIQGRVRMASFNLTVGAADNSGSAGEQYFHLLATLAL